MGGDGAWGQVFFNHDVYGDFDISVDYRDAVLAGCQNQIQLNLVFGGQYAANRRENWCGSRYSVWLDPPGSTVGATGTSDTSGTLRITRVGSTVTFYVNGNQIYQGNFNNSPVIDLWLSLQNNGTSDAISVTFDNFSVTADSIDGIDTTPEAFIFTDETDVPVSSVRTSNTMRVSGINSTANISISSCTGTNCEYQINGGSWTSVAGTVNNGYTVTVRQTSSASYSTQTDRQTDRQN